MSKLGPDPRLKDEPGDHTAQLWPKTTALLLLTLLILAMFQSSALVTAAYDLPSNTLTEEIVGAAENWHHLMQNTGPAGITEQLGEILESWRLALVETESY